MIALAVLAVLLGLGWCLGMREIDLEATAKEPCACKRCWYVGEVPAGVPSCPRALFLSFDGGGVRGMLMVVATAALGILMNKKGRWLSGWLA